jgi:uncharacterized protein (DUF983 family)
MTGVRAEAVTPTPEPAPLPAAFKGLCPRCGAPGLFKGWLAFADRCPACGLDYSRFNVGDGPAALLVLLLGAIVVGAAITIQLTLAPPIWLQLILWVPVTIAAVIGALRVAKAALLGSEYRTAAREGRITPLDPNP